MDILLAVGAVAFVIALLETYLDIRKFKAVVALGTALLACLPIVDWHDVIKIMAVSFFGTFMVALADRITTIQLTVSRSVGNLR